jgi:hypothetical protein
MKTLFPIALGALFAVTIVTSSFAQCSHGYEAADLSELIVAGAEKKKEEAMSTYDPAKVDALLGEKKLVETVEISD